MPKNPSFARRTAWPLSKNELTNALERHRQDNTPIIDLTESNPTRCAFAYPAQTIVSGLQKGRNMEYDPQPRGALDARRAVCRYYGERGAKVTPERIFLTSSTSEAYSYIFRLLADPGDRILFPCPSYPLFSFLGDLNDVDVRTYQLRYDRTWRIDMESLKRGLSRKVKAIVLVDPNNPTGSFASDEEIGQLSKLCREHGIALICDEVFADYAYSGAKERTSLTSRDEVLSFVLGGISKTLGLPQMKLSWIILNGPEKALKESSDRLEIIADTFLSVNTPAQNALSEWLSLRQTIQKEILGRVAENRSFLEERIVTVPGCELLSFQGGWYAVLKLPETISEEQWALTFLNEDHTYVHPGYFFDFEIGPVIVISLLPLRETFSQGIERIVSRIEIKGIPSGRLGQTY